MNTEHDANERGRKTSRFKWVLIGFLLIAGYFLITEHRAHVIQYLPFALLLACPLLHLFMHRGHGDGHGSHGDHGSGGGHRHTSDQEKERDEK